MGSGDRLAGIGLSGLALAGSLLGAQAALGGLADVLLVEIRPSSESGRFDIQVEVRHADSGWDHYANRWEVLAPDGSLLATRVLAHPHVRKQPFTRRLEGVRIPAEATWVRVRAHDLVHGYGGREVTLSVPHSTPKR